MLAESWDGLNLQTLRESPSLLAVRRDLPDRLRRDKFIPESKSAGEKAECPFRSEGGMLLVTRKQRSITPP